MTPPPTCRLGDRTIRRVGFGALRLLGLHGYGPPADAATAAAVLAEAADGADLIDTADCYGPHLSEQMIADVLHPYRDGLVIATKGGQTCPGPGRWVPAGDPAYLTASCEASLRRLRLEQVELYQLHCVDPSFGIERSTEAIAHLRERGLIRHVGLCNVTVQQLRAAQAIVPIVSVQNRFNVADRTDQPLVDLCARERLVYLAWFPLQRGILTRPGSDQLAAVARRLGVSRARLGLAWLLHRSPTLLPIPGTGSRAHLRDNFAALDLLGDPAVAKELAALDCGNDSCA